MQAVQILKKYWKYSQFRPGQEQIVQQIVNGNNVIAVLPTGGGKSICFQVPGMILGGITLVISPLIALMKDQVEQLEKRGIRAVAMHSHMAWKEQRNLMEKALQGEINFIYVSPERLVSQNFREYLPNLDVRLLVIDEAHCISQWGYDFRPPYLRIAEVYELFANKIPVCAFTASATFEVREDIKRKLEIESAWAFIGDFARDNLNFGVFCTANKNGKILELCRKIKGSIIVFVNSRRETEEYASFLQNYGIESEFYHAGLSAQTRTEKQEIWMQNKKRVMVCTNAFGMGVDKPDVEMVLHVQPSLSPEAYYQEAGRAGRNGNTSWCILLFEENDFNLLFKRLNQSYISASECSNVYNAVLNYLNVPPGAGAENSYAINLEQIAQRYQVEIMRLYLGIKALETLGIWVFTESDWSPSKVMLMENNAVIYNAKVKYKHLSGLLNYLLRNYSGIFDQHVRINESNIAKYLHEDEAITVKKLLELSNMGYIDYQPKNENSKIFMPHERTVYTDFDTQRLKDLHEHKVSQLQVMQSYCVNPSCRSAFWEYHFIQKNANDCQHCDNCKSKKEDTNNLHIDEVLLKKIGTKIKLNPITQHNLLRDIKNSQYKKYLVNLRWLIDNKQVKTNREGLLEWVNK